MMLILAKSLLYYIPDDMEIIDGMPASKPKDPDRVRAPWEE